MFGNDKPQPDSSVFPYEEAAISGEEMPKELSAPDQAYYIGIRWLCASVRMKVISLDTARKEKNRMRQMWEQFRFWFDLSKQWADSIRKTEAARAAYRKDRTLENADRLLAAVEGK